MPNDWNQVVGNTYDGGALKLYIRKICIENIRGFGREGQGVDLDLVRPDGSLAGWTVIAGVNGAGKTTFLRAAALSVSSVATAIALDESYAGWIHQGESQASVKAEIEWGELDHFQENGKLPAEPFSTGIRWTQSDPEGEPSIEQMDNLNRQGVRAAPRQGPIADNPSGWFVAGYGPFRRLTGHAYDAQRLMVGPGRLSRLVNLFREGASLVEGVQWLKDLDYQSKDGRPGAAELKEGVLKLLDDGLLPGNTRVDRVDSYGVWITRAGVSLPLTELSDGYRTMAALIIDLARHLHHAFGDLRLRQDAGKWIVPLEGVVLIDEVDAHLHVSWQQRIGFWLKQHFPRIQFIVATHSPFICQAADPGGLIRLAGPGEPARHVSERLYHTVVNGSLDEAVMTELFGLEHPHSHHSEEIRDEVARLEGRQIRGISTPQEENRLMDLLGQLPATESEDVDRVLRRLQTIP